MISVGGQEVGNGERKQGMRWTWKVNMASLYTCERVRKPRIVTYFDNKAGEAHKSYRFA